MNIKLSEQTRLYTTKDGATQLMPSFALAMVMNGDQDGFCLACGHIQGGVEPDAKRYTCNSCGKPKVYGAEELVSMGLTF